MCFCQMVLARQKTPEARLPFHDALILFRKMYPLIRKVNENPTLGVFILLAGRGNRTHMMLPSSRRRRDASGAAGRSRTDMGRPTRF